VSPPYVCFEIRYADERGGSGWTFQNIHVADPRIIVEGIKWRQPYYNSPIALSHGWLGIDEPDPDGSHYQESMTYCEKMQFLDCQTFFIDYCSLPQPPRSVTEEELFQERLLEANRYYRKSCLVLTEGAADYATRAWCMFELFVSSRGNAIINKVDLEGKLKDAFDLTRSFGQASAHTFNTRWKHGIGPGRSFTPKQLNQWARGGMGVNLAIYQMAQANRVKIVDYFRDSTLRLTKESDRKIIIESLEQIL
jgi:hypothetical protein